MSTKDKLLELFESDKGNYLSGEELAERLGCSRAAVWKAVNLLRSEGHSISAVTNKGYCLDPASDVLSQAGVEKYLGEYKGRIRLDVQKCVGSTNDVLRRLAAEGAPEGTVSVAGMQTGGKGRLGRSFFSPKDSGLYLSILLRPEMSAFDAVRITTAAAVAVSETVEKLSGRQAAIKWVNDVRIDGKKICGILTEASFSLENGGLEYAVVGIGVNAYEPEGGFPDEIKDIAGAVFTGHGEDLRCRLAGGIISRFMDLYRDLSSDDMLNSYRSRLEWKGDRIRVIRGSDEFECTLIDVDDAYALRVRLDDGSEKLISSGEITIRRKE